MTDLSASKNTETSDPWEDVASPLTGDYLERIRVPGGWLYRQTWWRLDQGNNHASATAIAFVPEPNRSAK